MDKSTYEVNAVIPPTLISPLLQLLQKQGGHLIQMRSHNSEQPIRKRSKISAHEVVMIRLRDDKGKKGLHRSDLREALKTSGHSPASVGPICSLLQKQGKVYSPRRGFWRVRASARAKA